MASAVEALVANSKPGEAFKGAGSAVGDAFLKARDLAQEEEKIKMMKAEAEAKKNYYDQQADQALFDGLKDASSIKDRKIRKLNLDVWAKRYEKMKGEPVSKDFLEVINTTDEGYNRAISRYFGEVQGLPFEQQAQAKASLMKGLPAYDALQFSQDIKPFEDSNYQQWKFQREESNKLQVEQMKNQRAEQSKKNNFSTEILKSAVGAGAEISPEAAKRFSEGTQTPEDIANLSKSRNQVQTNKEKREFESKNLAEILKNPKVPAWVKQGLQNEATPAEYKSQLMLMANDEIYNADKQKSDLDIQGKSTDIKAKESQMSINEEKLGLEKKKTEKELKYKDAQIARINQLISDTKAGGGGKPMTAGEKVRFTQSLRKETEKTGKDFNRIESSAAMIKKNLGLKTGAGDVAATKMFQRLFDDSVIYPQEMDQFSNVGGLVDNLKRYATSYKEGDKITPEVRQQMIDVARVLVPEHESYYKSNLAPINEQVKSMGIDPKQVFSSKTLQKLAAGGGTKSNPGNKQKFSPSQIQGMFQKGGKEKTIKYLKSKGYTDEELKGIK